jgi:hypothetical protein
MIGPTHTHGPIITGGPQTTSVAEAGTEGIGGLTSLGTVTLSDPLPSLSDPAPSASTATAAINARAFLASIATPIASDFLLAA